MKSNIALFTLIILTTFKEKIQFFQSISFSSTERFQNVKKQKKQKGGITYGWINIISYRS
jgi:hypothetical protein